MAESAARVWVQVDDEDAWALATVEERFGGSVILTRSHAPEGVDKSITISEEAFSKLAVATGALDVPVADLVNLDDVTAAAILHHLRLRYEADDIYTAISRNVLLAVNPVRRSQPLWTLAPCDS